MSHQIWYEKYRPNALAEYVWKSPTLEEQVRDYIAKAKLPHLMVTGPTGTGKTSLARVILRELKIGEQDILKLNASRENNAETVRSKIHAFCEAGGWGGIRVVFLDEADNMSMAAQQQLRGIMDEFAEHVRFVFTCNYPRRVIDAIKGRCSVIEIDGLDVEKMILRMADIFIAEGGDPSDENLGIIAEIASTCHPNMRRAVNTMEDGFRDGKLVRVALDSSEDADWEKGVLKAMTTGMSIADLRLLIVSITPDEMEQVFKLLYSRSAELFGEQEARAINMIATYMFRHPSCAYPEINICDMLLQLMGLRNNANAAR